ncbi:MAG: hypothetical protein H6891_03105 [Brucellaceae bacterium]|nr:hypothetical protein [Brucellaceae bacterium]
MTLDDDTAEFTTRFPSALRAVLIALGLAACIWPAVSLWRGLYPPNLLSPFFLVIVVGAIVVGAAFVAGAVFSPETRWRLLDGRVRLDTRNLFSRRSLEVVAGDVEELAVRTIEWDSRADTWSVSMRLKTGETFETPDYGKRTMAESKRAAIAAALGLD